MTPTKRPAWSFSALQSMETCPKKHYHTKVIKDVPDPPGAEAAWGVKVHKALELRVRDGTALPSELAHLERVVAPVLDCPPELVSAEQQIALNAQMRPTTWFGKDAWVRSVLDLIVLSRKHDSAVVLDWKTGKRKPESDQLKLFAAVAFAMIESLEQVETGFVWLKDDKTDKDTFTRADAPKIWQEFEPRIVRFYRAFDTGSFPPKPSGLCRKHCPVPRSVCEFSGRS